MWKYYITGVLVSVISGYILLGMMMSFDAYGGPILLDSMYVLPGGLLAGFVGYGLERRFASSLLHKIGLIFLTIIQSVILSFVSIIFFFWWID